MPGYGGPGIHLEHLHRYSLAAAIVEGAVLDLGCGVGYGSRLLARAARRVVGIDRSAAAVGLAGDEFAAPNLHYIAGDARSLPLPAATFDWVVCFELIEHLQEGEAVVEEIARVLAPDGQLLLSTPNRPVYSEGRGYSNPFHPRELDADELRALLEAAFEDVVLFGQRLAAGSIIRNLGRPSPPLRVEAFDPDPELGQELRHDGGPTYLLALCARRRRRRRPGAYESVMAGRLEAFIEEEAAQRAEVEAGIRAAYESVVDCLVKQLGEFDARIRQLGGDLESHHASRQEEAARLSGELSEERSRRARQESQSETAERRYQEELSALQVELSALQEELSALQVERSRAEAELRATYESVVDRLVTQLGEFDARIRRLGGEVELHHAARQALAVQAAELQLTLERTEADLDSVHQRLQARESDLDAIHRSKMWRFWMTYHKVRGVPRRGQSVAATPEPRDAQKPLVPGPPPPLSPGAVDVSVVIPTLNGGAVLERCLAAVQQQRTPRTIEILCVDSESSAADLAMMERYGARVIGIDRSEFNHGLTRDLGAAQSRGRVLVFLNQDAVPCDSDWLDNLVAPLFAGNGCVAVQGAILEVPDPEQRFFWASCGERFYFTRESKRWIERYFGIGFSTVNAAIRRDVWERHPFGYAPIMEDKKWQREIVAAGRGIAVAPQAAVYHTHNYDLNSLRRRCESEGFGWRTLGETYSLVDMLADMLQPRIYADLLRGLRRGQVRSWAEVLFPLLRPVLLFRGNHWGRAVKL